MVIWKLMKESLTAEVASITVGLVSGTILASIIDRFSATPELFVLLPILFGISNDIDGQLAARLGSALHMGVIESRFAYNKELFNIIAASFLLSILCSLYAGVLAHFFSSVGGIRVGGLSRLVIIALFSGLLSRIISIIVTTTLSLFLFSKNIDPDSVMGPILTSYGDVLTIFTLYLCLEFVGGLKIEEIIDDHLTIGLVTVFFMILIYFSWFKRQKVVATDMRSVYRVDKIIRESFLALLIPLSYTAPAGLAIAHFESLFVHNPPLLVMLPPLNDLAGDFGIIISSRLSTALYTGIARPRFSEIGILKEEFITILLVGGFSAIFLGVTCYFFSYSLGLANLGPETLICLSLMSIIALILLEILLSVGICFVSFSKGLDPDNITVPIVTDLGDIGGILFLIASSMILGVI